MLSISELMDCQSFTPKYEVAFVRNFRQLGVVNTLYYRLPQWYIRVIY